MADDPMSSAWAKYHWASKHMHAVDAAITRSLDPKTHTVPLDVQIEVQGKSATALVRVGGLPSIRTDCGLALGDVLQNFRSALDHLAWGLVKIGNDPRPKKPKRVYFPMAESAKSFKRQINDWLPGVPRDYRTIVRRYQPYRRGERSKAIRWLRNFSDVDKHRVLVPTVINAHDLNAQFISNWQVARVDYLLKRPRALNVRAPILRLHLRSASRTDCQVQVNGDLTLLPSLGRGVPLGNSLPLIRATVLEILTTFDSLL